MKLSTHSPFASYQKAIQSRSISGSLLRRGNRKSSRLNIKSFLLLLALYFLCLPAAHATKLPVALKKTIETKFPQVNIRLDGVMETKRGTLFVPLIPNSTSEKEVVTLKAVYPQKNPLILEFDNGWFFIKLSKSGEKLLLALPEHLDQKTIVAIKASHLPGDLIVPLNMGVIASLKSVIGDLDVEVVDKQADSEEDQDEFMNSSASETPVISINGNIFITSPATGKIIILDKDFNKLSELQTDGTPGGMAVCNDRLFIADQSKNRILIIDPATSKFDGQIDLLASSSPKGVTALGKGKFLYVTEAASNNVTVLEISTRKVLIRTRVRPGPGRIEITPNGYLLLVLNTQSAELTFVSTLNQRNLGSIAIGQMPSDILVTANSRTAYVSNRLSNTISVIDIGQRKVVRTVKTGEGPTGMALSADQKQLFVANAKDNSISIFNLETFENEKDIRLPLDVEFPGSIMLMPDGKQLIVTSAATDTVGVLNTETRSFDKQPQIGYTSVNVIFVPQLP
ncbi:MAG: beta-propeller fold lactonase family protein [Candidatus Obscuribacterales bacterium]|nr:beta-propeller fold lactonase family protein [Candidatus Obscuribacterales bacterium]